MKQIISESLEKAISYQAYTQLVDELISQGKSTGHNQTEALLDYSTLNSRRMKRLDKTLQLLEATKLALNTVKKPITWLVISESWCGDAAQTLPVIHKMAEQSSKIDLKIVLRDDNEELMDLFLTNGSKSIPKLIALDEENNVQYTWGPRPSEGTKLVQDYKKKHGKIDDPLKLDLQLWYNKNKGVNTQEDLVKLL